MTTYVNDKNYLTISIPSNFMQTEKEKSMSFSTTVM